MSIKNIYSQNAYELLRYNEDAILIDVRTPKEWQEIGVPKLEKNLEKTKLFFISWRLSPNMSLNNQFELQIMSNIGNKQNRLLFLCRSGTRSLEAANFTISLGYSNCYNISDGFEGNILGFGWKQNNLPWQSL
jgi:rhodanese-related sulfurtransferase